MLEPITAPDFEAGFPDSRPYYSEMRREMLNACVRFVNEELAPSGPAAEESLQKIEAALRWVARWKDVVAFRDQFADLWKIARQNDRYTLGIVEKAYEKHQQALARAKK